MTNITDCRKKINVDETRGTYPLFAKHNTGAGICFAKRVLIPTLWPGLSIGILSTLISTSLYGD